MHTAKEPFIENDPDLVAQALAQILDSRNYPLLIHSNKGKHRWFETSIAEDWRSVELWLAVYGNCKDGVLHPFSTNTIVTLKEKEKAIYRSPFLQESTLTVQFIENFDNKIEFDTQHKPAWMPWPIPVYIIIQCYAIYTSTPLKTH
jgi:hypothetical protein